MQGRAKRLYAKRWAKIRLAEAITKLKNLSWFRTKESQFRFVVSQTNKQKLLATLTLRNGRNQSPYFTIND